MDIIGKILGLPLGYVMKLCFDIFKDYGVAIIIFTLLTKVILFPVSLLVQNNSVKMIKMKPELDALKFQYVDDKDALVDAQSALYKKEKYSPFAGIIPLLLQIPLIFGLINVVYNPMTHIKHMPTEVIESFEIKTVELLGLSSIDDLGSSPELEVMRNVKLDPTPYLSIEGYTEEEILSYIDEMNSVNTVFLGMDLADTPKIFPIDLLFLIPLFAGLSAALMCIIQNKINVLQIEQGFLAKWGMSLFTIAFSTYFAFLVPSGVGLYWIWGNIFSIPVMYIVNIIYNPKKYIDYRSLESMKEKMKLEKINEKEYNKLSKLFYKEITRGDNLSQMKLMFYSESSGFYKYFKNIIESILEDSDIDITYVTSDPNDAIFKMDNPRIKPYYIAGNQLITLMMRLECQIVVMTTPDLEKYHIKRSKLKKNIEYIYTDHGCGSLNLTYRTGALDHFDTVFVVSQSQGIEVRKMEKLRGTHKKRIVKVGYGLIDNMIESYSENKASIEIKRERPTILIAPSWQPDNILDSCIHDILDSLLASNKYRVIVRPHPQYLRRFPMQMEQLIEKYRPQFSENFEIQTDFSSNETVYSADLLITDWSNIAYEFSFTTNKPTLFINTAMKVVNKDYDKIDIVPFDITGRDEVGRSIEKSDCVNIAEIAHELILNRASYEDQIEALKHEYFYNLGSSGKVGADYIIHRINRIPFN